MQDLVLTLLDSTVRVKGRIPHDLLDLLHDLAASGVVEDSSASATLEIEARGAHLVIIADDGHVVAAARDEHTLTQSVVTALNGLALRLDPSRLHLHAASLDLSNSGVVLVGASGAGKSTLAMAMLERGAGYLSDEITTLGPAAGQISSYPKPLTLGADAAQFLGHGTESSAEVAFRASEYGAVVPQTVAELVVFPIYEPTAPPTIKRLAEPDAIARLFSQSLDAKRYGPRSLIILADLATRGACWEVRHRDARQASSWIERLARPPTGSPPITRELHCDSLGRRHTVWLGITQGGGVLIDDQVERVLTLSTAETDALEAAANGTQSDMANNLLSRLGGEYIATSAVWSG